MHAFLTKVVLDNLKACPRYGLPDIATRNACNLDYKYCTVFVRYRLMEYMYMHVAIYSVSGEDYTSIDLNTRRL